jgi:hypothetical protein
MKSKIKSFLILIITLLIGIAIGFEISEIDIKKHFEAMDSFKKPEGFIKIFEGIIKPDPNQKEVVDSILFKYYEKMERIRHSGMEEITNMMDSMNVELKKNLNNEQISRLSEEMQRMKKNPPQPLPPTGKKP